MDGIGLRKSLIISLCIHVAVVLAWIVLEPSRSSKQPSPDQWIMVEVQPKKPPSKAQRIVRTEEGEKTDQASPDAFLGEKTQIVREQMVSKAKETQTESKRSPERRREAESKAQEVSKARGLAKFGLPILQNEQLAKDREEAFQHDPSRYTWYRGESDAVKRPSEYIKGIEEGEHTALNTKEYVFFSYYERIRKRLDLAWSNNLRHRLGKFYRAGRRLASDTEHVTKIMVTLNQAGEIVRVRIVSESGSRDLDDAAVQAFNQAGPFPNPPTGILTDNGLVEIRWDFILRS